MRICWIGTLFLGLFHFALLPSSKGLEGEKIGADDVYKPRKWSQVRDGPYRMVVSSRDQESGETQLDSRKGTRTRDVPESKEDKDTTKTDDISLSKEKSADEESDPDSRNASGNKPSSRSPKEPSEETVPVSKNSEQEGDVVIPKNKDVEEDVVNTPKSRGGERRKHKVKLDHTESSVFPYDAYDKNEKSTQRAITKLARKRERILINENFRKAHRVSIPEGYFSTAHPSTIGYKLYNHFRPIERGVPRESIIPFFDFGKKLSTGKTPSAINSIEGSSTPGLGSYESTTHREDDDLYHEDMDVSVVKLRPIERNTVPRVRPPLKNPELTAYFGPNPTEKRNYQDSVTSTTQTPELSTRGFTTTQTSIPTNPPTDLPNTIPTTIIPPDPYESQVNETSAYSNISPSHSFTSEEINIENISSASLNKTSAALKEFNSTIKDEELKPSPTAKVLSTAVVSSVSVKETYRHPKIKSMESPAHDVEIIASNATELQFQPLKALEDQNVTESRAEPTNLHSNLSYRVDKSLNGVVDPTTHRPSFERHYYNRTNPSLRNNSTIHPTTIRPKFRSNIEYRPFTTKVPPTTTHQSVNRSLYSTHQREHSKNKFISSLHSKPDNKTVSVNRTIESSTLPTDAVKNPINSNDNKSKMYLTIRSRLPNQSATYRSTFRRNGTKPYPPVLRVIATPSSYIEVPRISSRVSNSTTTTLVPEIVPTKNPNLSRGEGINEDILTTEVSPESSSKDSVPTKPKSVFVPKTPDPPREVRMNNHRMPAHEVTTEDPAVDVTTIVFHSIDSTTEVPEDPASTRPVKPHSNDHVNIVTVAPRTTSTKPNLSWVYLGQRNRTRVDSAAVEVAYSSGFGIAAYVLAALGVIPLILGGFVLLRQILIKSKKKMLDESEYSSEYNRTPLPAKLPRIPSHVNWEVEKSNILNPSQQSSSQNTIQHQSSTQSPQISHQNTLHMTSQHLPIQPGKWEFPRDKLRLQTLLGEGNFGQVWKAEADDISGHEGLTRLVAVKTVKEGSGGREREDLLRELAIMKELGPHPNVVTLLGCCTDREPFLLIMEYVMYGKMLTFLREHRTRAHYFNFSDLNSALVSRDLTVFAYCVARGMEFLVSKGIIHRDLAARNILVDHNKLCKIADFGMSRNVRDTGEIYEQRPNRGALPIRWMAPEALHCSVFTHKSDVWSFGILVWEIITLGCTPYQTMGAREVMRRVREGYRLDKPIHCSQDLYKVICRCWSADPNKRPTFTDLKHDFATLLSDPQTNGACVDLDALTEEMSSHSC